MGDEDWSAKQPAARRCAAVLAVGVLGLTGACGTERGSAPQGEGAADGGPTYHAGGTVPDFACPPPPVEGEAPAPVTGPDVLPTGALAVRMCDSGGLFGLAPVDALTAAAEAVAESVNGLALAAPCEIVPRDLGPTWDLAFLYPDGHTQTVRGSTHGCGGVEIGSAVRGDRQDADRPLRLFQRLLWEQRLSTAPPAMSAVSATPPRCGNRDGEKIAAATFMPLQKPVTLHRAVLCWRYETESDQPDRQAAIGRADLTALLEDLNHNRSGRGATEHECVGPDVIHYRIVGVNDWGDRVLLDGYCGAFDLSGTNSDVWRPSSTSQAIFDRLVGGRPSVIATPGKDAPPDQVVAIWVDLVNLGEQARAAKVWPDAPDLPAGARIDVKTGQVRPVRADPGTAQADYHELVEVGSLYRLVTADGSWVDYHEVRFTLGRDGSDRPWRILSMADDGQVLTGR